MERHLYSVHQEELVRTTTLRRVAGELDDPLAVDYFLHRRMAQIALFISAPVVYEIDDAQAVARTLNDLTGGFIAYYDELQQLPVVHMARGGSLGVVEDSRVVACFTPMNVAIDQQKSLRRGKALIGALSPRVGIELDQEIEIGSFGGALQVAQPVVSALYIVR
jgi:hypothetical protein